MPRRKRSGQEVDAALGSSASSIVKRYHEQTKHHFHRYARSQGYLDWDSQPDPFRRFHGYPLVPLSLSAGEDGPEYDDLFIPGKIPIRPVDFASISAFFELSLALSAWKEYRGSRWALRINPSSGNLHPTEGYLVLGPLDGLHDAPAVYHYAPKVHALERRTTFPLDTWRPLIRGFPEGTFLAGLSSIYWREAWKYGERAYRYCQHDAGHALAAMAISAAAQGWSARWLCGMSDDEVAALLGLDRDEDIGDAEREHPELLVAIVPAHASSDGVWPRRISPEAIAQIAAGEWHGTANQLSTDHVHWDAIDDVARSCRKDRSEVLENGESDELSPPPLVPHRSGIPAARIIRQRRSAVELDGRTRISAKQFYLMMDRALPRADIVPWNALGPPVCVDLGLFIHLVDGIPPGLYALIRSPKRLSALKRTMRTSFHWQRPPGCPPMLPLYLLAEGDCRRLATRVSCHQAIAGMGAFSLGMIAEFDGSLETHGPWFYRRLFWETGVIGQILYLEAEAAGVRGTGMGCFFDEPVHEVFGLCNMTYQSLYHFTLGGAVEDSRLTTKPPYPFAK